MANFRMLLRKQTEKQYCKLPFAQWTNGKQIEENYLGFRYLFLYETAA